MKRRTVSSPDNQHPDTASEFTLLEGIEKLDKDLIAALKKGEVEFTREDIRIIADLYYTIQKVRIGLNNRVSANERRTDTGTASFASYFLSQLERLEEQAARSLNAYAASDDLCQWATSQKGVGGILAATLDAFLEIERAPVVGNIWRFAGLDPSLRWIGREGARELCVRLKAKHAKPAEAIPDAAAELKIRIETIEKFALQYGEGRITWDSLGKALSRCPYNRRLKTLCWKISDSFVKSHNRPGCVYGQIYAERKLKELEMNQQGKFAEEAKRILASKKFTKKEVIATLKAGQLTLGHIENRARRYAVKQFLADWHHMAYRIRLGKEPPLPYPIAHLGHEHLRPVPGSIMAE